MEEAANLAVQRLSRPLQMLTFAIGPFALEELLQSLLGLITRSSLSWHIHIGGTGLASTSG